MYFDVAPLCLLPSNSPQYPVLHLLPAFTYSFIIAIINNPDSS